MEEVVKNVLYAIHYILNRNGYKFSSKQLSNADEFIIPFIGELEISEKEFNVKVLGTPKLVGDRRIIPLLIKYFAYIEDNIGLYNELREDNYKFFEGFKIKFYALDRMITGNFKRNEYKNLLLKDEDALSSFYYTVRSLDDETKEKVCKDFSDIVHIDHTTLTVGYNGEDELNHYNYLTSNNILLFGKEFLLKLNKKQRNIINNINFGLNEEDALKIKELFNKYPEFSEIPISIEVLHLFSVDEIGVMNLKNYILYKRALKNNVFDRMKEILKLDSSFDCNKDFIKEEIFKVLSNEEIIGLSDEAKNEISSIDIPKIKDTLVIPVRKIKKIVAQDIKRRENSESIDSIKK